MGCCCSKPPPVQVPDVYFTKAWRAKLPSMKGKVVAITGTTSGTGYVAAMEMTKLGAHVLMLNRPSGRATAALAAVKIAPAVDDWRESQVGRTATLGPQKPDDKVLPALPAPPADVKVEQARGCGHNPRQPNSNPACRP